MSEKNENQRRSLLVDALLHAPIGLLYELADAYPEAVKRGKSQVQISKLLVQMAAKRNKKEVESSVEDVIKEAAQFFKNIGEKLETVCEDSQQESTADSSQTEPEGTSSKTAVSNEPFADYDSLNARTLIKRLSTVDASQLEAIKKYEQTNKSRKSVLDKIKSLQR